MENVKKHLALRGLKIKDKVTELEGVVDFISFDLYGCVQARIEPGLNKDNEEVDSVWLDVSRLTKKSKKPVLVIPESNLVIIKEQLRMLGLKVEHKTIGRKGFVDTIGFDLYGSVYAGIDPGLDKNKKKINCMWVNILSLKMLSKEPVMKVPDFDFGLVADGDHGPAEKIDRCCK